MVSFWLKRLPEKSFHGIFSYLSCVFSDVAYIYFVTVKQNLLSDSVTSWLRKKSSKNANNLTLAFFAPSKKSKITQCVLLSPCREDIIAEYSANRTARIAKDGRIRSHSALMQRLFLNAKRGARCHKRVTSGDMRVTKDCSSFFSLPHCLRIYFVNLSHRKMHLCIENSDDNIIEILGAMLEEACLKKGRIFFSWSPPFLWTEERFCRHWKIVPLK
jgi:hypothetical protein